MTERDSIIAAFSPIEMETYLARGGSIGEAHDMAGAHAMLRARDAVPELPPSRDDDEIWPAIA